MAYEVAARGKHFTAVSKDAASHFHRYFNPLAKITVIPNGLPDSIFELGAQSSRRNSKEIAFATVLQGWSRQKNATTALRAFQIVRDEAPEAKLLMFGDDYEKNGKAHEWAVRHNLDANVTFVGLLPNDILLKRVRDEVDIVVHPSLNESFSMTAVEAMALRKPVIAGERTPGVREVLGFGESGVLADVFNPKAIAEQMLRLVEDATYRDRMAEKRLCPSQPLFIGWKRSHSNTRVSTNNSPATKRTDPFYCVAFHRASKPAIRNKTNREYDFLAAIESAQAGSPRRGKVLALLFSLADCDFFRLYSYAEVQF